MKCHICLTATGRNKSGLCNRCFGLVLKGKTLDSIRQSLGGIANQMAFTSRYAANVCRRYRRRKHR